MFNLLIFLTQHHANHINMYTGVVYAFKISCFFCFTVPQKPNTPATHHLFRRPLSQLNSPVFVSDSEDDDDDNVVIRSSWKTRHSKPTPHLKTNKAKDDRNDEENSPPSPLLPPSPFVPCIPPKTPASPKRTFSAPAALDESSSSEEEFVSLLERLKMKNPTGTSFLPKTTKGKVSDDYSMKVFLITVLMSLFVLSLMRL